MNVLHSPRLETLLQRLETDSLVYYQFDSLEVSHAIFTRMGGSSEGHLASLNVGSTVGDDPQNVTTNRKRMRESLGLRSDAMRTTWQVHGADVLVANGRLPRSEPPPKADAIIADSPNVGLTMRFADCVPILLHDARRGVVGMAHAGWRGTAANVVAATVHAMQETYNCQPSDIVAGIGPSICVDHYIVGAEVVAAIQETFVDTEGLIRTTEDGTTHLDLWASNQRALYEAGVAKVEIAGICTACNTDEFFSHRAEQGQTGRFGAIATLSS